MEINQQNFETEVINSDMPVVIDFWAAWCGPCRMIAPTIDELEKEYQGRAKVGKVDIDSNPELASKYGVMTIPTIAIFKNGEVAEQVAGLKTKADLMSMIDSVL